MQMQSLGAACTVTGSMHLLTLGAPAGGTRQLLVDCGLFQGGEDLEARNHETFPFDPADLDAVVLTHAHLDHVGRLPLLSNGATAGRCTAPRPPQRWPRRCCWTRRGCRWRDTVRPCAAPAAQGREDEVAPPLYEEHDVHNALALLRPVLVSASRRRWPACGSRRSGPGTSWAACTWCSKLRSGRLILSGDLGNRESGLQPDFTPPPEADAVVIETTYANRTHRAWPGTLAEFSEVLRASVRAGGKILIPSFAIERAQTILHTLKGLMDSGEVPRIPVFLDSPMAARATHAYFEYGDELIPAVRGALRAGEDPFQPSTLHVVLTGDESRRLNRYDGPAIILAGNGMLTGGRIQHHLRHHLWKPGTSVIIVSLPVAGHPGRAAGGRGRARAAHGRGPRRAGPGAHHRRVLGPRRSG